jgi:hypothetical protein
MRRASSGYGHESTLAAESAFGTIGGMFLPARWSARVVLACHLAGQGQRMPLRRSMGSGRSFAARASIAHASRTGDEVVRQRLLRRTFWHGEDNAESVEMVGPDAVLHDQRGVVFRNSRKATACSRGAFTATRWAAGPGASRNPSKSRLVGATPSGRRRVRSHRGLGWLKRRSRRQTLESSNRRPQSRIGIEARVGRVCWYQCQCGHDTKVRAENCKDQAASTIII